MEFETVAASVIDGAFLKYLRIILSTRCLALWRSCHSALAYPSFCQTVRRSVRVRRVGVRRRNCRAKRWKWRRVACKCCTSTYSYSYSSIFRKFATLVFLECCDREMKNFLGLLPVAIEFVRTAYSEYDSVQGRNLLLRRSFLPLLIVWNRLAVVVYGRVGTRTYEYNNIVRHYFCSRIVTSS